MNIFSFFRKFMGRQDDTHPVETSSQVSDFSESFANRDQTAMTQGATVLIVDDSRTQLTAIQKWLASAGYNTLLAEDGKAGIELAKRNAPDLILMDIVMPQVNGFQATRYLKKHSATQDVPIILMSGEEQSSGKLWGKKLGAADFMVKPLRKDLLLTRVAELVTVKNSRLDYGLSSLDVG